MNKAKSQKVDRLQTKPVETKDTLSEPVLPSPVLEPKLDIPHESSIKYNQNIQEITRFLEKLIHSKVTFFTGSDTKEKAGVVVGIEKKNVPYLARYSLSNQNSLIIKVQEHGSTEIKEYNTLDGFHLAKLVQ